MDRYEAGQTWDMADVRPAVMCDDHPERPATDIGVALNRCDECVQADVARVIRNMRARSGPEIDL